MSSTSDPSGDGAAQRAAAARYPGLDLLRAIAILLVIPFHAWNYVKWPPFSVFFARHGWIGVDLFFVLSGFLIASQVVATVRAQGRVSIRGFYWRRAWRILPLYWLVLLLYHVWPGFREAPELDPAWRFLLFVMNYGRKGDAFSHAWSLCVEEHFYLIFPLVASLVVWRPRVFRPDWILGLLLLGGMVWRWHLWRAGGSYYPDAYRPTHTHLDGLLVGVALALVRSERPGWWAAWARRPRLLLAAGTAGVAAGLHALATGGAYAWVATFPLVSAGFGLWLVGVMALGFRLAERSVPGAATVAALSYALYLTHKQMIQLAVRLTGVTAESPGAAVAVAALLVPALAAALHWGVERPCLRLRDRWRL